MLHYQEFLINFEGGFVRRGFCGQVLLSLVRFTGLPVISFIQTVCLLIYGAFMLWILRKGYTRGWCWWLFLSPLLCGHTVDIVRKDYLQLLLFIPVLYLCAKDTLALGGRCALLFLLLLELLLHEAFVFWGHRSRFLP